MSFREESETTNAPRHDKFGEALEFLKRYLKNPVETMRRLPDWDWPMLLIFYSSLAGICGLAGGALSRHFTQMISGAIVFPITSTVGAFIATGFLYYTFAFFFHREVAIKTIFTIVILSLLPFLALSVISAWLMPLNVLGFFISGLLLVVGLAENTHVDRRRIFKLVAIIYLIYVVFWIFNTINSRTEKEKYKDRSSPEAIETLKKEMNN